MLSWHIVTRATYDAAAESAKTSEKIFFLSDTGEIYRGTQNFTESVVLYTSEPTTKAVGKLYVNATTLEGKIWNGSAWTTVIQPVQAAIVSGDTSKPVSSKAVEDYVTDQIAAVTGSDGLVASVAYDSANRELDVTMADGTTDAVKLSNLAVDLVYEKSTGKLQVKDATGATIGTGVNLDLERFVAEASYDHDTGVITLKFNDDQDPLTIDIGDLVDTYTASNSNTISLTVTGNEFVAEAIVATTAGNMLQATESGLYVAATDLSAYSTTTQMNSAISTAVSNFNTNTVAPIAFDVATLKNASTTHAAKVSGATAGNLASLTAEGDLDDSGVKVGGSTLASSASASVLATEAAVAAIRTALVESINGKMSKVASGHADELIVADANGDAALSGVKVGGATFAATPDDKTAATEKGAVAYVQGYAVAKANVVAAGSMATTVTAASDEKVASEKAIVDALTWKTTV